MTSDNTQLSASTDAESLSALFDGELRDDAARFAMRRLGHDPQWRDACGRWQMIGDVLRGEACAAAPRGFAEQVQAALAGEEMDAIEQPPAPGSLAIERFPGAARRGWRVGRLGGAALAASLAFVAILVVKPGFDAGGAFEGLDGGTPSGVALGEPPAPETGVSRGVVSSGERASTTASSNVQAPADPAGSAAAALATTAVAAAELPRRASQRRSRGQSQRAALRAGSSRQESVPARLADRSPGFADPANVVVAATSGTNSPESATATSHPFLPRQEVVSRPWPQAVLPGYSGSGGLNVGYETRQSANVSPTFYPFEPRSSELSFGPGSRDGRRTESVPPDGQPVSDPQPPPPVEGPRR